jgi:NADH:ubiquinone oxidoreductase subunit 6 (subunit J)
MNFQLLNKQRKMILIAAAVGLISVFLPWIKLSAGMFGQEVVSESVNGFHGWGILAFLAFAVACVISLLGDQTKTLDKTMWIVALAGGAVALISVVISLLNSPAGEAMLADIKFGFGIWIALAASLGTIGAAWMFKNPEDTLKDGFESLKKSVAMPSNSTPGGASSSRPSGGSSRMEELERLIKMKNEGKITEEEYQQLKSKLL